MQYCYDGRAWAHCAASMRARSIATMWALNTALPQHKWTLCTVNWLWGFDRLPFAVIKHKRILPRWRNDQLWNLLVLCTFICLGNLNLGRTGMAFSGLTPNKCLDKAMSQHEQNNEVLIVTWTFFILNVKVRRPSVGVGTEHSAFRIQRSRTMAPW